MTTEKQPAEATPRPWFRSSRGRVLPGTDDWPDEQRAWTAIGDTVTVADLRRLLRVEAAARECLGQKLAFSVEPESCWQRLRAALDPTAAGEGRWPRWECSACTRNANQCDASPDGRCCPECNHDDPTAAGEWTCDWTPDDLNPGPECPYCSGQMCARFDGLNCQHNLIERHGDPTAAGEGP